MNINVKFNIEQIVFLKTDMEQLPRMVVGYQVTKHSILYILAQGGGETYHHDIEIDDEKDILIQISPN